ncbi:MAG: hypothetical protein NTX52_13135 [Planctomycetota bacterium]|nr:hypothetical protein [Planctomycetota bacterium]
MKAVLKGRSVYYPIEIIDYLKKIDRLQNEERLSYRKIANRDDIKKELAKFKLLKETELSIDTRVMDPGFFANFYSAKVNLAFFFRWPADSAIIKFLDSIVDKRGQYAREYYRINNQMRQQAMKTATITDDLRGKKEVLGYKIDYLHSIMEATTKEGVKLLKDKKLTLAQWFDPIRKLDRR